MILCVPGMSNAVRVIRKEHLMKYAAFISYRHSELDMEIAKKVHTGLETYRIPGSVQKKTGKKKVGRVFRDQEELPIGSDLDDNISTALQGSEYLIVICSPRTPESYWVCKEIETFIEMHDRNHILAVLIEGEPNESFPPQLLTDENGNPVEPLAADVRGADRKERNAKFKTEILRLAAPVIGCTYDDLRQRDRERRIKRLVAIVSSIAAVVAVAGTAFGIYNANVAKKMTQLANEKAALADEKTRLAEEITVQYTGKQENQSRFFAEESLALLKSGNREDAALVAMEGLPSEGNDRPYVADAEYALARALNAYDDGSNMSYDRTLSMDLSVSEMYRNDDSSKIVTTDSGSKVYVWDTSDWSLKTSISPAVDDTNYYVTVKGADADDTGVYVATEENELLKYNYDGEEEFRKEYEESIVHVDACNALNKVVVVCRDGLYILDAKSGKTLETFPDTTGYAYVKGAKYIAEFGKMILPHYDSETTRTYVTIFDPSTYEMSDCMISEGYYLDGTITPDGNFPVLSCNNDLLNNGVTRVMVDLISPEGNTLWSRELNVNVKYVMTFNSIIKAHKYIADDGTQNKDIVVAFEAEAFTLDEDTGAVKTTFTLPGDANALAVMNSNSFGRVGYRQGNIDFVDFAEGRIYSEYTFTTNDSIRDWIVTDNKLIYASAFSPDLHVIGFHEAYDLEDFTKFDTRISPKGVSSDGEYFAVAPNDDYTTISFRDKDGKEIYKFDKGEFITEVYLYPDRALLADKDGIWKVDPFNKTANLVDPEKLGFGGFSSNSSVSKDGTKAVFWSLRDLTVIDLEKEESICNLTAEDGHMGKAVVTNDGTKAYVVNGNDTLSEVNTSDGSVTEFKDENIRTVAGSFDKDCLAISSNGKYVALCCMDGKVRVADTASHETVAEIPLQSYLRSFIDFTDDCTHIVMQGDDYRIRVWDIEKNAFVYTMDGTASVDYIVCDEDSGLMAVCQGYGLFLFETGGYGCVAYAENGMFYLESNDSILLSNDRANVQRIYHKDYKTLMDEAKKQFPGVTLSDEKKVKYNIN